MISCRSSFTNVVLTLKTADFLSHYCGKIANVLPILLFGQDLQLVLKNYAPLMVTEASFETAEDLSLSLVLEECNREMIEH